MRWNCTCYAFSKTRNKRKPKKGNSFSWCRVSFIIYSALVSVHNIQEPHIIPVTITAVPYFLLAAAHLSFTQLIQTVLLDFVSSLN